MNNGAIASIAIVTALLTTTATVFVIEKTGVLKEPVVQSVVPDLKGLDEGSATNSLQNAKLVMMRGGSVVSVDAKPGTVLRQSVAPGMKLDHGQTVLVTFAEAAPRVPDVSGMTVEEAKHALSGQGYEIVIADPEYDEKVPEGKILSQKPAANATLEQGKTVIIKASAGLGEVELPNYRGQPANQASLELEKLGLKATIRWVQWAETTSNVVLKQNPEAGTRVKRDAEVEFTVNR